MTQSPLKFEREGALAVLTLDNPEKRNPVNAALIAAMLAAFQEINCDTSISCAILTANGPVFCAGGNLKGMYAREGVFGGPLAELRRYYTEGIQRLTLAFHDLQVPLVAAVNGPAIGAGLDFATMCTIRIASERATFAESFIKLGLVSGDGGAWFLPRVIGDSAAAEMTLTGDTIDAEAAKALGIISRVVPHDELMVCARDIAARIVKNPSHSIRLNHKLLRESRRVELATALDLAAGMQAIVQQTSDHREAVAALVEKRQPEFKGT